jgi:hypothetical protein
MGFLFSILMFVVIVVLIIIVGGLSILRSIFFGGRNRSNANTSRQYGGSQERNESQYTQKQTSKKKIISKDEGEYIDFEEMK